MAARLFSGLSVSNVKGTIMNISDSPTRVELFNERSRFVTKNAKQEDTPTLTLVDEKERNEAEYHRRPDPLIQALMDKLPKPNTTWSLEERAKWLRGGSGLPLSLQSGLQRRHCRCEA